MKTRMLLFLACFTALSVIVACSGDDGSNGRDGTDGTAVYAATSADCIVCHSSVAEEMAIGAHMSGTRTVAGLSERCQPCHDTLVDGVSDSQELFVKLKMADMHPEAGGAGITCIGCHWEDGSVAGGHYDRVDMLAYQCGVCHDGVDSEYNMPSSHSRYTDLNLVEGYNASRHAVFSAHATFVEAEENGINDPVYVRFCVACHTGSGFNKFFKENIEGDAFYSDNTQGGRTRFDSITDGMIIPANPVACSACHDPHSTDLALKEDTVNGISMSSEFRTCTQCHAVNIATVDRGSQGNVPVAAIDSEVLDNTTAGTGLTDGIGVVTLDMAAIGYHGLDYAVTGGSTYAVIRAGRTIMDTHFAGNLVTAVEVVDGEYIIRERQEVPGYNIRPGLDKACTVCHDPHRGSMMGVHNSTVDYELTSAGLPDFSKRTNQAGIDFVNSFAQSMHNSNLREHANTCSRCHSGTNFTEYAADKVPYDAGTADYTLAYDRQKTCFTCHDMTKYDEDGRITGEVLPWQRTDGDFTFYWYEDGRDYADANIDVIPGANLGNNIICYECHSGDRSSNNALRIISTYAAADLGSRNNNPAAPHYLVTAIVEGVHLYELSGKTYTRNARHYANAGCIDCHDVNSESHTFESAVVLATPSDKTSAVVGLNISSTKTQCLTCHLPGTESNFINQANTKKNGIQVALDELAADFANLYGVTFTRAANGSFGAVTADWLALAGGSDVNRARDLLGIAANMHYLALQNNGARAAYSHNPTYVRQMLWDMKMVLNSSASGAYTAPAAQIFVGSSRAN